MVTAYLPTSIKKYKYGTGDIPFRNVDWKHLENEGCELKDLIIKCLQLDPKNRLTANECLSHPWLIKDNIKYTNARSKMLKEDKIDLSAMECSNTTKNSIY